MFIHNRLTQHVSGIIMPIVRRKDCIKPRVVLAWMCWLRLCGVGTQAELSALSSCPDSIQPKPIHPGGFKQSVLLTMGIMMSETCGVNLLYLCHLLVLSSPTILFIRTHNCPTS